MSSSLLPLGIVCILAAIVGGGLKALGIEVPIVRSLTRQIILAAFGVVLIVFSLLAPKPEQERKPVSAVSNLRVLEQQAQLEQQIQDDVSHACAKLRAWPGSVQGEDVLNDLSEPLKKVEEKTFENTRSKVIADLYRCVGGAHLIAAGELPNKLGIALPYLNQSVEFDPTQTLLKQNIAALQTILTNKGGDTSVILTNLLQVLRDNDPEIPALVAQMTEATRSTEMQAKQWLLHQATSPPILDFLEELRYGIKKKTGVDSPVDITTKKLPSGLVEVQAQVGPNVFNWEVDYHAKKYTPLNKLTEDLMTIVLKQKP